MKLGEVLWKGVGTTATKIEERVRAGESAEDVIASYGGHPYFRAGIRRQWEAFVRSKEPDPLTLLSPWQLTELDRMRGAIAGLENARWQVAVTKDLLDGAADEMRRVELQGSLDAAQAELRYAMRVVKELGLLKGEIPPAAPLKGVTP